MLLLCKTSEKVSRLPVMYQHLSVLGLIPHAFRQATVVLVSVREHDAADIGELYPVSSETVAERLCSLVRFRSDVYQCQRILANQVDVDVTDIKRRRDRDWDDLHLSVLDQ